MPRTTPGGKAKYVNNDYTFNGVDVPCIDNQQVNIAASAPALTYTLFASTEIGVMLQCASA